MKKISTLCALVFSAVFLNAQTISFSLNSSNTEAANVNLYNAAGVKVYSSDIAIQKGINTIAQDTYINFSNGIYILEVASTTKKLAVKLTK